MFGLFRACGPEAVENSGPILVWFRRDLRLADNPALSWAADTGRPVIPVFVLEAGDYGGASRWWLHGSLSALGKALERLNSRLILRRGPAVRTIATLAQETKAAAIAWNRLYDSGARDGKIEAHCRENGMEPRSFNASLLFEPWTVRTAQGSPYRVFTPFWRQCLRLEPEPPSLAVTGSTRVVAGERRARTLESEKPAPGLGGGLPRRMAAGRRRGAAEA